MSGRLELRISVEDVGKRVSVRSLTDPDTGPERFTDTVGVLTSWTQGVVCVTRKSGEQVRLAEQRLVAGKVVPSAPARRRGAPVASSRELERVAARAWQPLELRELGAWQLRAAGGFTRRANSVLPLGSPQMPLPEALAYVTTWYEERGLPPCLQLAFGAEDSDEQLAAVLAERGWSPVATAEVWTAGLAPVADLAAGRVGEGDQNPPVELARSVEENWLRRYRGSTLPRPAGSKVRQVLSSGPSVWFATLPEAAEVGSGGVPAAIGRLVVDGRWAGFTAVETAPDRRRERLATRVMSALCDKALEEGASAAYLQVEADNEAACRMYTELGFARSHGYQHWRAPQGHQESHGGQRNQEGDDDGSGPEPDE